MFDGSEHRITQKMFVLLFNLCSCLVGINQICIVYILFLNGDANAENLIQNNLLLITFYLLLLFLECLSSFLSFLMIVA